MNINYLDYCKMVVLSSMEAIRTRNYYKFYENIEALTRVINITYYNITLDKFITCDDDNNDMDTKYTLNFEHDVIDELFEYIDVQESYFESRLWMLEQISQIIKSGNAIIGKNGLFVDNHTNKYKFKGLIGFDFFKAYFDKVYYQNMLVDKESFFYAINTDFILKDIDLPRDMDTQIAEDLFVLKCNINLKAFKLDRTPRVEITSWLSKYINMFIGKYFDMAYEGEDYSFTYSELARHNLVMRDGESDVDFDRRSFKDMLIRNLNSKFNEKFPNYYINLYSCKLNPHNFYLDSEYSEIKSLDQVVEDINSKYFDDKISITLDLLETVLNSYVSDIKIPEFLMKDVARYMNATDDDRDDISEELFKKVRSINNDSQDDYDQLIVKAILNVKPSDAKDFKLFHAIKIYLKANYDEGELYPSNPKIIEIIKKKFPDLFDRYTNMFRKENHWNDMDESLNIQLDLDRKKALVDYIVEDRDELIKVFIYILGVNSSYNHHRINYDFIDDLSYDAFDARVYAKDCAPKVRRIESIEEKIIEGVLDIKKKGSLNGVRLLRMANINSKLEERDLLVDILGTYDIKEIEGIMMCRVFGEKVGTIINASISNYDTMFVNGNKVKLYQFDDSDNLLGMVEISIKDLIKFIAMNK